jgi:hypothetical protein
LAGWACPSLPSTPIRLRQPVKDFCVCPHNSLWPPCLLLLWLLLR